MFARPLTQSVFDLQHLRAAVFIPAPSSRSFGHWPLTKDGLPAPFPLLRGGGKRGGVQGSSGMFLFCLSMTKGSNQELKRCSNPPASTHRPTTNFHIPIYCYFLGTCGSYLLALSPKAYRHLGLRIPPHAYFEGTASSMYRGITSQQGCYRHSYICYSRQIKYCRNPINRSTPKRTWE